MKTLSSGELKFNLIAHRGFSAIAPENTLSAFSAAIQHQADAIECDVQLSADNVPIIFHDATLERTTNGKGKVSDKTLQQLKTLDAGSWFDTQFAFEPIPTLQEVLDLLKETDLQLYAEVKQTDRWSDTDIDNFVETIVSQGWKDRCIIASFDANFLQRISDRHQSVMLGYNVAETSEYLEKLNQAASGGKAFMLCQYQLLLNHSALIEATSKQGVEIVAWTVDQPEDLQKLAQLGIRRIITNALLNS